MSRSQSRCMMLILRHAWLNLLDKHMTTGRINQVAVVVSTRLGQNHQVSHRTLQKIRVDTRNRLIRVFDKLNKSLSHKSKSSFAIVKYHALCKRLRSLQRSAASKHKLHCTSTFRETSLKAVNTASIQSTCLYSPYYRCGRL